MGACLCVRAGVVKQNQENLSCGSERRGPGVGARAQGECVCVRVKGGTRNLARGPPGFCVWLGLCAAFARARFGRSLWGCQGRASAGGCACVRVCETKVCLFFFFCFMLHFHLPPHSSSLASATRTQGLACTRAPALWQSGHRPCTRPCVCIACIAWHVREEVRERGEQRRNATAQRGRAMGQLSSPPRDRLCTRAHTLSHAHSHPHCIGRRLDHAPERGV